MKFTLRPYQTEAVTLLRDDIRLGSDRPILCLPTGAGKTVTFSHLAEMAQRKGSRVGVVCHRTELVSQAKETMEAYGINPYMITYGMVQTYVRSPHKIPPMDLCIIDECHTGNFRKFVDLLPESVKIIGVTATPIGSSKKKPLRDVFTSVIAPVQINELIEDGFLSKPVYHVWKIAETTLVKVGGEYTAESQSKVFSKTDLLNAYNRRVGKTLIFCSSIAQTVEIYETITGIQDHAPAYMVHSKMNTKEREAIISEYKATPDSTMINCGILTAGFDDPPITTVIVYRATTSLALWLQMCGRGSRVTPIKKRFYIFDMGNNRERLLAWEVNRDWSALFDLQGRNPKEGEIPLKKCPSCEGFIYASAKVCPLCEAVQPIKTKVEMMADEIQVIGDYSELPLHLKKPQSEMTVIELIERALCGSPSTGLPYRNGWILAEMKSRENATELFHEFAALKGYKQSWIYRHI